MEEAKSIVPIARTKRAIYRIRSQKIILDREPAELYGVQTKALKQAVKGNLDRFPSDFMFELTD